MAQFKHEMAIERGEVIEVKSSEESEVEEDRDKRPERKSSCVRQWSISALGMVSLTLC